MSNTVWLVRWFDWGSTGVVGIFSTYELSLEAKEQYKKENRFHRVETDAYELDEK